ncbi:helix-turn-helix domain-containing protein [Nocardia wallacei]|uniref:helix-turn-helix domain-containing protein n=1 Tax=Nocardia wallacei TaxID=480035 RepID=UPI002453976E|nr:hypothetical protein [Nocardia wallacei]
MRHNALRLTQDEFAALAKISADTVSNWERRNGGRYVLSGRYARLMDDVLASLTNDQRRRFRAALPGGGDTTTLDPGIDGVGSEEVDLVALGRRGFLLGAGVALGSSRTDTAPPMPACMVGGLRATAQTYRSCYRMAPARDLLGAAHSHMQLALSMRPGDQPEPARSNLLTTVGEMAALAGIILGLDQGRWRHCAPYLHVADRAARESGNIELQAVVTACHAFQAAYSRDPDPKLGLDYAESARAIAARGASSTTRGWVAAVASERHADLGDARASRKLLDDARSALDAGPADADRYSGIGAFDAAKVTAYEGSNHRRLGDFNKAVAVLDTALADLDPSLRRHRATALIDRAEAHRDARRVDAAVADTREVLALVAETQHVGTLDRAVELARSARDTGAREGIDLWNDALAAKAAATSLA